jgi:hypothetical protein
MLANIRRHEKADLLLFGREGRNEVPIRFDCPHTGLKRRCKLDRLLDDNEVIIDIKAVADASPKGFASLAYRLGYHCQAAWYQDAVAALAGSCPAFVFIVAEKDPPFTVNVFEPSPEFVELGREENESDLRRFAACKETGVWEFETHGTILNLPAPAWAKYEKDWSTT